VAPRVVETLQPDIAQRTGPVGQCGERGQPVGHVIGALILVERLVEQIGFIQVLCPQSFLIGACRT
jgi:hypothetical protein